MQDIVDRLLEAMNEQEPVALATIIAVPDSVPLPIGHKLLVQFDGRVIGDFGESEAGSWLVEAVKRDAIEALPTGRVEVKSYRLPESEDAIEVAIEAFLPPPTVVILGAGHIAVPVSRISKVLGYRVVVIDDRPEFANRERFPEADVVEAKDFLEAIDALKVTPSTYFVLVTRGHKHDQVSLSKIIWTDPAYIGMIGSKRRVRTVIKHLAASGVPEERLKRVHSPIGIDIAAETPEEIAVAIVAEIIKVRRGGTARSLSERPARPLAPTR